MTVDAVLEKMEDEPLFQETFETLCVIFDDNVTWPLHPRQMPAVILLAGEGVLTPAAYALAAVDLNFTADELARHGDRLPFDVYESAAVYFGGDAAHCIGKNPAAGMLALGNLMARLRELRQAHKHKTDSDTQMDIYIKTMKLGSILSDMALPEVQQGYSDGFLRLCAREADAAADALLTLDRRMFSNIGHDAMALTDTIGHFRQHVLGRDARQALAEKSDAVRDLRARTATTGRKFRL